MTALSSFSPFGTAEKPDGKRVAEERERLGRSRQVVPSKQVALNVHCDVKHTSNSDSVGDGVRMRNQVVRSDAKDSERCFEQPRAKRVNAQFYCSGTHVLQIAQSNIATPALKGKTPQGL